MPSILDRHGQRRPRVDPREHRVAAQGFCVSGEISLASGGLTQPPAISNGGTTARQLSFDAPQETALKIKALDARGEEIENSSRRSRPRFGGSKLAIGAPMIPRPDGTRRAPSRTAPRDSSQCAANSIVRSPLCSIPRLRRTGHRRRGAAAHSSGRSCVSSRRLPSKGHLSARPSAGRQPARRLRDRDRRDPRNRVGRGAGSFRYVRRSRHD
jgi:hypothetical protein